MGWRWTDEDVEHDTFYSHQSTYKKKTQCLRVGLDLSSIFFLTVLMLFTELPLKPALFDDFILPSIHNAVAVHIATITPTPFPFFLKP